MKSAIDSIPAVLMIMLVFLALGGCSGPGPRIIVTVGPTAGPETATPSPTPGIALPAVVVSGDVTTVKGSDDRLIKGIRLGEGVYIIKWSCSGEYVSFSFTDIDGNGGDDISKGRASGERLFVVDGSSALPGNFTFMAISDSDWTVSISRPDASSPQTLPLAVSCGEPDGAVTGPFRAHAGNMKISYSFSRMPSGTGHVNIYDVSTGRPFYTRPMTEGAMVGQSNAEVPSDSVYIAQVILPPGASHGEITISQE